MVDGGSAAKGYKDSSDKEINKLHNGELLAGFVALWLFADTRVVYKIIE